MKYLVLLCDGMADRPFEALGGKTPMQLAKKPNMDKLAAVSELGMCKTVAQGLKPGSDVANLSVMGYDPKVYYSGRSPLEALSIGVAMKDDDVAIRCNVVTISEEDTAFEDRIIIDHSSDEISTEDATVLIEAVKKGLAMEGYSFYAGTSYRHCLIWEKGKVVELTPPHDVLEQVIGQYLPKDEVLRDMMKRSHDILKDHPINIERKKQGLNPANCIWFWGAGTKPMLSDFQEKTGKKGIMISAVDLLKGIAVGAGMDNAYVEGANGGLHTNYEGKMQAALNAVTEDGYDFAYIHVEAPDEMGHQGSVERKIQAIEYLDEKIIAPLVKNLKEREIDFRMLILPDHPTPVRVRTHTADDVPYLLYDSTLEREEKWSYNEQAASDSGNFVDKGHTLIDKLFER